MTRRPVHDPARYDQIWKERVLPINGAYTGRAQPRRSAGGGILPEPGREI